MQVRVSPEINALLDDAAALSVRRGRFFVGIDSLFEAILQSSHLLPKSVTPQHLKSLNLVAQGLAREEWTGVVPEAGQEVFYTQRCAKVANEAARLAQMLGGGPPAMGHLLLAMLSDPYAAPSRVMDRLGPQRGQLVEALRQDLHRNRGAVRPGPASPQEGGNAAPQAPADKDEQKGDRRSQLASLTRDLTELARQGLIEPAIGRSRETFQILEILTRKNKNNVILAGDAGTGKTCIVEGLALLLASNRTDGILDEFRVLELNIAALTAGTQYRGAFEERITALLDEVKQSANVILFIDEVHLIMGAGSTDGSSMDLANLLKPALARGELRCIGATTMEEYRKFIEKDPAVERRFQMVRIEELSPNATLEVLEKLRPSLEKHHGLRIGSRALKAAVELTQRYMPNRRFPDKAIDVLDQACARYRLKVAAANARTASGKGDGKMPERLAEGKVTPYDIQRVVSQLTSIPIEEISETERRRLESLEQLLAQRVIGQEEAVRKAAAAVKRARAGLSAPDRPCAVMLFLGPTGVGKTQLAKALADIVFGSGKHLITFDMSEYVEAHSVSRLLGAPPGYVGSDEEGRLTGAVRTLPFSILLFDEIEKAHPRIFDIFLPVLDEGRLKDSRGRDVSFRNCIIIFTSNVGAELLKHGGEGSHDKVMEALHRQFRPEFINRIDEIVPFYHLMFEDIRAILKLNFRELNARLREKDIHLRVYQRAYEYLAEQGYSREFGARELRRAVDRLVANRISEMVLENAFAPGDYVEVLMENEQLLIRKGSKERRTVEEPE